MPNLFAELKIPRALRSFVISYLLLHVIAAVVFVWALTVSVRSLMTADARNQMQAMATMLSEHVDQLELKMNDPGLPEFLRQLGQKTRFRFTLIDNDGNVVADSQTTGDIGYHGDRPEILAATTKQAGFSERYSATLQIPMMYLAIPVVTESADQPPGHIRVATPAVPIQSAIRSAQRYFWTFAIVLGLITGLLMTLFAVFITKPLSIFADAARRIGVGQFEAFPALLNRSDEWRSLADAYRNMQTELATREQRIVKNRDRLQAVLSSMVEGVVSVSPKCEVLIANRAACRMLNISETELRGRNLLEVVRSPELVAAVEKTQYERSFTITEFQISSLDHRRTISARVSVLPNEAPGAVAETDESELPGVVVVLHDITELRHLENMRQNFVANVSHELKTPLASIKAYAETLKLGAINDQERNLQFVEQIESQADFLNQQIQDLLQLARVESGQAAWDIQRLSLNHESEQCVARFAELARTNQISLSLQPGDPPPLARADIEGLATVLNNLVTNALSYTPAGGDVCVSTYYEGNSAVVEVADTGIGIAMEHQARIFERFYRVDKARSRDKGGTGLGLSIVKHLVLSFGGSVDFESKPGEGTKFRIRLPKFVK